MALPTVIAPAIALLALLMGGKPGPPDGDLALSDRADWFPLRIGKPAPPRLESPVPGEPGGWRFVFHGGTWTSGRCEVSVDGERLAFAGLEAVEIEYRTPAGSETPDLAVGTALGRYGAEIPPTDGEWRMERWTPSDFRPLGDTEYPLGDAALRHLRFDTPDGGFAREAVLDVRSVRFLCGPRRPQPPVARSDSQDSFLFGPFLLGGNRSLLGEIGRAGANLVVEYGPAAWPRVAVEDHLDYARGAGVGVAAAITRELHGDALRAETRLLPMASHPALAAWYVFDEPDGAVLRGLPQEDASPGALERRARALGPLPTLVSCMNSRGLKRYARVADLICTDYYLPAYSPGRPLTKIHSNAESVAEIAREAGATPLLVIQLADPQWNVPEQVQTPASLHPQAYAALAAGMRGVLLFQAAGAAQAFDRNQLGSDLWPAFLRLAGEMAAIGPVARRWQRVPGEPWLGEEMGNVRASCFRDGETDWIVLVNLSTKAEDVTLSGACLEDARRLTDPRTGWSVDLRDGSWSGRLAALQERVLRVERGRARQVRPEIVERFPAFPEGSAPLRFDRVLVGATFLPPPPDGTVRLLLDGRDVTADAVFHRGPAVSVRLLARDLAAGAHEVTVTWPGDGTTLRESWTFRVVPFTLPFRDDFDAEGLSDSWGACDDVIWEYHDLDEPPAAGAIGVTNGALHVRSTGGGLGVRLRAFEAPDRFVLSFRVRMPREGVIVVERSSVFQKLRLPAGESSVRMVEDPGARVFLVNGRERARWSPSLQHRGGGLGIGVAAGEEAFFDDVEVSLR